MISDTGATAVDAIHPETPDVLIVGAGVVGLSSAWSLAEYGLQVTVVDPAPGRGASWVAAGMLAPVSEAHYGEEQLLPILVDAAHRWPDFTAALEERTGASIGYRPCGTIVVAADASDRSLIQDLIALPLRLGLEVQSLSTRACRAAVPALAPGVRGGAEMACDHQVDNRRLVEALVKACFSAGVHFLYETVDRIELDRNGAVEAVTLGDNTRLPGRRVLLAAGARSSMIDGVPREALPSVRPVKGHVLRLRGASPSLLTRTVRGLVHGRSCYLVPREDGSLVVGATEEERGFDDHVQAGPVHDLLHDARALVPGIDELFLEEAIAGLRPGSPDNRPFIGWTGIEGLAVATGHYRNGILLAPITADAVLELVTTGRVPKQMEAFDPQRELFGS